MKTLETQENKKQKELNELELTATRIAQEIQWNEEWIRLSIVEKTALMEASYEGTLRAARRLFTDIKKDCEWHLTDLKNNHFPYQADTEKKIKALKLELRTPEQVARDEEAEARRRRRREIHQL